MRRTNKTRPDLLFSYTLRIDDGAAPNPFRGLCTLTICKPAIRRVAEPGDWIVGLGSKRAPSGDLSGKVVYAMRVFEVVNMREYEALPQIRRLRIPDVQSNFLPDRLGDCIYYDFRGHSARQRPGVHSAINLRTDLNGENALIASEYYYFGSWAVGLPKGLKGICHQTQGHKSQANQRYLKPFVKWIRNLGFEPGQHGWPDYQINWNSKVKCICLPRRRGDEFDEVVGLREIVGSLC